MIKLIDQKLGYINTYVADTDNDATSYETVCGIGSQIYVIESGNVYILNGDRVWELSMAGGGSGEGGLPEGGNVGDVLTKAAEGVEWKPASGGTVTKTLTLDDFVVEELEPEQEGETRYKYSYDISNNIGTKYTMIIESEGHGTGHTLLRPSLEVGVNISNKYMTDYTIHSSKVVPEMRDFHIVSAQQKNSYIVNTSIDFAANVTGAPWSSTSKEQCNISAMEITNTKFYIIKNQGVEFFSITLLQE